MSPARPASQGGSPVRDTYLPYALPQFGEAERRELLDALDSGWITTGPRVKAFEDALAQWVGAPHMICMDSCTAALHIALVLLDLKPGDEVITTPMTFASTVTSILHAGGTPVLVDVEPDTLNLDPRRVAEAVTARTRALLPGHFGGHPASMDELLALAGTHGLAVIEDAAHAIGARYKGRMIGTLGDLTCFSFYATKNLTTAEGGALATASDAFAERARLLSLHGMSRDAWKRYTSAGSWYYEIVEAGFKYNMTDLEAALGLHQLQRLPEFSARRAELAARFDAGLAGLVDVPTVREGVDAVYHLYPIRLHLNRLSIDRARFIDELKAENIGTTVNFIPIHYHPFFRERLGLERGAFPVTEAAYERMISLPLYPRMTDADADDVITAVHKLHAAYRR